MKSVSLFEEARDENKHTEHGDILNLIFSSVKQNKLKSVVIMFTKERWKASNVLRGIMLHSLIIFRY